MLQRDAARLLEQILARLAEDPGLALPSRLMRAIFVEVARRPLVRALLLSDAEVLGALATDTAVAAAQRELGGNQNYLELLRQQHLLRPDLTVAAAGVILSGVMRGFFAGQDAARTSARRSPSRPTCSPTCCTAAWRSRGNHRRTRWPRWPRG